MTSIINCTVFGILAIISIILAIFNIIRIKKKIGFAAKCYRSWVLYFCFFILILAILVVICSVAMIVFQPLNAKTNVDKYKEETTTILKNSNKTISDILGGNSVQTCMGNIANVIKPEVPIDKMEKKFGFADVRDNVDGVQQKLKNFKGWITKFLEMLKGVSCQQLKIETKKKLKKIGEIFHPTAENGMNGMIKEVKAISHLIDTIDSALADVITKLEKYVSSEIMNSLADRISEDLGNLEVIINQLLEFDEKPTRIMFIIFLVVYGIYSSASIITTSIAIVGCFKWFRKRSEPTKLMTYPVYAMILLLFLTSITFLFFYLEIIEDLNICGVQQNDQIFFDSVCPSSNAKFFSILKSNNSLSIETIGEILKLKEYEKDFGSELKKSFKSIVIPDAMKTEAKTIKEFSEILLSHDRDCNIDREYSSVLGELYALLEKMFVGATIYGNQIQKFDTSAPFAEFPVAIEKSLVDINKANFVCNHIYEYSQGICILAGEILDIYTISVYLLLIAQLFSILANNLFCMMAECWKKHDDIMKENERKEKKRIDEKNKKEQEEAAKRAEKEELAKPKFDIAAAKLKLENVYRQTEELKEKVEEKLDRRLSRGLDNIPNAPGVETEASTSINE
ncbi:unnamed protein product [Caenorhabditis angaria]|uniref:Uncharacterized protein n=1 Tax=Caenorhabditis angaria TaxID=860376 RepID=A0A9P1I7N6_9PELO|nr:unnamed protein product [Caenorhabditis angaria]